MDRCVMCIISSVRRIHFWTEEMLPGITQAVRSTICDLPRRVSSEIAPSCIIVYPALSIAVQLKRWYLVSYNCSSTICDFTSWYIVRHSA